jgi:hypothetical protein
MLYFSITPAAKYLKEISKPEHIMTKKLLLISSIFFLNSCKKHATETVQTMQITHIDTMAKLLANTWHINKIGEDSNNNGVVDSGETHVESTSNFYAYTFYDNYIMADTNHYTNGYDLGGLGVWHWGTNKSQLYIAADSIDFEEFILSQITDTSLLLKKVGYNYWWECIPYRRL